MKKITLRFSAPVKSVRISGENGVEPQPPPPAAVNDELLQQSYRQGYQDGAAAARQELAPLLQALAVQANGIDKQWQELVKKLEPQAIELVIQVLEHLLLKETQAGRCDIVRTVEKVFAELRTVPALNVLELQAHPDDIEVLSQQAAGYGEIRLLANARIARGDCLLKTNLGQVVVSWRDRLRQMETLLRESALC